MSRTTRVVLGKHPYPDGTIHMAFVERMLRAFCEVRAGDTLLVCGGFTIGTTSEAEQGKDFLRHYTASIQNHEPKRAHILTHCPLYLEKTSQTTGENIRHARGIVEKIGIERVVVYCGDAQCPKAKVFVWWHWPRNYQVIWRTSDDHMSISKQYLQRTLGTFLATVDPFECWIAHPKLKRLLKRIFIAR